MLSIEFGSEPESKFLLDVSVSNLLKRLSVLIIVDDMVYSKSILQLNEPLRSKLLIEVLMWFLFQKIFQNLQSVKALWIICK